MIVISLYTYSGNVDQVVTVCRLTSDIMRAVGFRFRVDGGGRLRGVCCRRRDFRVQTRTHADEVVTNVVFGVFGV